MNITQIIDHIFYIMSHRYVNILYSLPTSWDVFFYYQVTIIVL